MSIKTFLRLLAVIFIVSALLTLGWQYSQYHARSSGYPPGTRVGGIPVDGLDQTQAAQRLLSVYDLPVTAKYNQAAFSLIPSQTGFVLDLNAMLAEADQYKTGWLACFWRHLWRSAAPDTEIELKYHLDEARLRAFLQNEIVPRYDQPAQPAMPMPGGAEFTSGQAGEVLDVDQTVPVLLKAMLNAEDRSAALPTKSVVVAKPSPGVLKIMLQQLLTVARYDGVIEIYYEDLTGGAKIDFAMDNGMEIAPEVPFTAASMIKIPVMAAMFNAVDLPLSGDAEANLKLMINKSDNASTDTIMEKYLGGNLAPVTVTQTARKMGLQNTFLAGYFYLGAPLLDRIQTPANSRTDVAVGLDIYNQTTAADIASVLKQMNACASDGQGLAQTFAGSITQDECTLMLDVLHNNHLPSLLTAGLPEGTWIAQKHGWVREDDGVMHTIGNAGLVKSPGGDYVIAVFLYHPNQLPYEPSNLLMAKLSEAVYNYQQLITK